MERDRGAETCISGNECGNECGGMGGGSGKICKLHNAEDDLRVDSKAVSEME